MYTSRYADLVGIVYLFMEEHEPTLLPRIKHSSQWEWPMYAAALDMLVSPMRDIDKVKFIKALKQPTNIVGEWYGLQSVAAWLYSIPHTDHIIN